MSSGWLSRNRYLLRMSYDNVIMSSGWHRLPFLSHPDEIVRFSTPRGGPSALPYYEAFFFSSSIMSGSYVFILLEQANQSWCPGTGYSLYEGYYRIYAPRFRLFTDINAALLSMGPMGTNFSEVWMHVQICLQNDILLRPQYVDKVVIARIKETLIWDVNITFET